MLYTCVFKREQLKKLRGIVMDKLIHELECINEDDSIEVHSAALEMKECADILITLTKLSTIETVVDSLEGITKATKEMVEKSPIAVVGTINLEKGPTRKPSPDPEPIPEDTAAAVSSVENPAEPEDADDPENDLPSEPRTCKDCEHCTDRSGKGAGVQYKCGLSDAWFGRNLGCDAFRRKK